MDNINEISNLDFPIAKIIREVLHELSSEMRTELLEGKTEDQFISDRVDIYLHELEQAMHQGFDELGAKEIAWKECLADMGKHNG